MSSCIRHKEDLTYILRREKGGVPVVDRSLSFTMGMLLLSSEKD